jgi:hypothetical protein
MSFAKNTKITLIATAALIVSGAAFAASDSVTTTNLSPAVQMDYDNAHRDANAYADAKKAKVDERLLARTGDAKTGESAQVAQVKTQDKTSK